MALIDCPNCGKKVSDRAETCPHCGTWTSNYTKCPECEARIVEGGNICSNCGFSLKGKRRTKISLSIVMLLVVLAFTGISYYVFVSDKQEHGVSTHSEINPDLSFFEVKGRVKYFKQQANKGQGWSDGFKCFFDELGNLDQDLSALNQVTLQRNEMGQLIQMSERDNLGKYVTDYTWNDDRVSIETYHHNGSTSTWTCKTKKFYNKQGVLIREEWEHGADEDAEFREGVTTYQYSLFDNNGNWIERESVRSFEYRLHGAIKWNKKSIHTMQRRTIEYYK